MAAGSDLGAEALPNEVLTEILARLPAKSVGRFRCVSRGWSATLSSDYFIDLHRQRANRPDHPRLLLTANGSSYDGYLYSWQPGGVDGAVEKLMRDDFGLQEVVTKPCRGLVLIRVTDCGGYYVVNPSSGETLPLPDSQVPFKMAYKISGRPVEPPCYRRVSYGLGYCTARKEYKVVRLFSDLLSGPQPGDGGGIFTPTTCEVFVLGTVATSYWRPSAERSPFCSVSQWNPAVFLDGYLHFLCFDGGIVTFSIGDETFGDP